MWITFGLSLALFFSPLQTPATQVPDDPTRDTSDISKECATVLTGLARLTLADSHRLLPADGMQWLALPFSLAYAECVPVTTHAERSRPGSELTAPKKIQDVKPEYPPDLQKNRVQGPVLIEAR